MSRARRKRGSPAPEVSGLSASETNTRLLRARGNPASCVRGSFEWSPFNSASSEAPCERSKLLRLLSIHQKLEEHQPHFILGLLPVPHPLRGTARIVGILSGVVVSELQIDL